MNVHQIIRRPVVTEKSTIARELSNVVTLAVDPRANKQQIRAAVQELFNVTVDPAQRNNLKDAKPETAARMVKELKAWKKTIPESAHPERAAQTSSAEHAVVLRAVKRAGYEPLTGVVKNDERGGGTGVFGCADTKREVYLWFEIPKESRSHLKSKSVWELELAITTCSGNKQAPKAADELQVDFMGSFKEIGSDAASLAAWSAAVPLQSFTPDYRDGLTAGRYKIPLRDFNGKAAGTGRYLLFRLSDASPERMHWSSCSLDTSVMVD